MIDWLIERASDPAAIDLRYSLSRLLSSKAAQNFDVVIIDCPPRFSTSAINALCASSHVVIPTVPDLSSLDASSRFISMAEALFSELNPFLSVAGIVPLMSEAANLTNAESERLDKFLDRNSYQRSRLRLFRNLRHADTVANVAHDNIYYLSAPNNALRQRVGIVASDIADAIGC